jgi:predicted dehydrogenase
MHQGGVVNKVRIAVIGLGWIGFRHAQLAMAIDELELAAVCDPAEKAGELARQLGKPFYRDHREMMDKETLDGVVVATPTGLHVDVGIECARRGVHLLVEKPVADTVEEGRRLVQAAEESRVQLLIGHYRRFNPAVEAAREIVQSGSIGRLLGVSGLWTVFKEPEYFVPEWRRKPGAGPVLTNLIHDVDCLRFICGEITGVQSMTSAAAREFEVEDTAGVLLRFANGAIGTMLVSDTTPSPWGFEAATGDNPDLYKTGENCYHILGSEGSFSFPELRIWRYSDRTKAGWRYPIEKTSLADNVSAADLEPLATQLAHFGRVIRGQEKPRVSGRDGLQTLAITRSVLETGVSEALAVHETLCGQKTLLVARG